MCGEGCTAGLCGRKITMITYIKFVTTHNAMAFSPNQKLIQHNVITFQGVWGMSSEADQAQLVQTC